jgi:hypothetical protein
MFRFAVVTVLLVCACLFAPSARANGVATCSSSNVEGLGMFYCSSSWAWMQPTQVSASTLVLTCTQSGTTAGVQNMATCAYAGKTKWVKRSTLTGTELLGYCAQDQITPWEACDAPNGKEGWLKASDALGTTTSPPPASEPPASTPPPSGTYSVTLNWSAVTQTVTGTGTAVSNYRIEYGIGNFNSIANTASTSITLTNLAAGTWQFRITAISSADGAGTPSSAVTHTVGSTGGGGTTTPPPATSWMVARNGSQSTRTVYEAVLPSAGTTMVRGNTEGTIAVGRSCGNEVFKQGTDSYRDVTEGEVTLASPSYNGRKHVAVCTLQ